MSDPHWGDVPPPPPPPPPAYSPRPATPPSGPLTLPPQPIAQPPAAQQEISRPLLVAAGVAVVAFLAIVAFALTRSPSAATPAAAQSAVATTSAPATPSATAAAGTVYTDPASQWTARFAGTPEYHTTVIPSAAGQLSYTYAEYSAAGVDQVVGAILLPPGATFDLTKSVQGIAASEHATVTSTRPTTFQGYPAIEAVLSTPVGVLKCQVVSVRSVVYVFGTVGPADPPADYSAFIASVKLTPH